MSCARVRVPLARVRVRLFLAQLIVGVRLSWGAFDVVWIELFMLRRCLFLHVAEVLLDLWVAFGSICAVQCCMFVACFYRK